MLLQDDIIDIAALALEKAFILHATDGLSDCKFLHA